jgi:putative endonuclease
MRGGFVYMMTNKPHGVLYTGVTANLPARLLQHREGRGSSFCKRYNCMQLVLAEQYPTIVEAIAREKAVKEWPRLWKLELIHAANPEWLDLCETLNC